MKIEFWGVRGSFPKPGKDFCKYGGHTTCLNIIFNDDFQLIVDAGVGIIDLGNKLIKNPIKDMHILWTHFHWDHIQGFPFFKPIYTPNQNIHCYSGFEEGWVKDLKSQMNGVNFPVKFEELVSNVMFNSFEDLSDIQSEVHIEKLKTNHPRGAYAYAIKHHQKRVVFSPDNELKVPGKPTTSFDEFVKFTKDADILIHDAQYLPNEIEQKRGWGHSSIDDLCELANKAKVKKVIVFHHDPVRTDSDLDALYKLIPTYLKLQFVF